MTGTFIALGGNLGPVESNFKNAISLISQLPGSEVIKISSMISSSPVGSVAGASYKNAVIKLETNLKPVVLLKSLQTIEESFGRDRTVRWGPRPVDLDIILYGDQIISQPELNIPHIASWYRRFVLVPMVEIAPDVIHPIKNITFRELVNWFDNAEFCVGLTGLSEKSRDNLRTKLKNAFPEFEFIDWTFQENQSEKNPVLILWLGEDENQNVSFEDLPEIPRLDLSDIQGDLFERIVEVVQSISLN